MSTSFDAACSRMPAAYAVTSSHSAHGACLQPAAHVNSPTSYSCMLSGTHGHISRSCSSRRVVDLCSTLRDASNALTSMCPVALRKGKSSGSALTYRCWHYGLGLEQNLLIHWRVSGDRIRDGGLITHTVNFGERSFDLIAFVASIGE